MFAGEVKKMQAEKMKPQEQLTLEPYERDHAVVVGVYRYGFATIPILSSQETVASKYFIISSFWWEEYK